VSGISPTTTKDNLHKFFSFCGSIEKIDVETSEELEKSEHQAATVYFEKSSAAKTATMLNGGSLDGATITVKEVGVVEEGHHDDQEPLPEGVPFHQSDKPRATIAAEYLASGYKITDDILQRGIDMDKKHGISSRFTAWFNALDSGVGSRVLGADQTVTGKVQATLNDVSGKARSVDEQKGYSKAVYEYAASITQALDPTNKWREKVLSFYNSTSKGVTDIHEEARRIAESKKASGSSPTSASAGATGAEVPPSNPPTTAAPLAT